MELLSKREVGMTVEVLTVSIARHAEMARRATAEDVEHAPFRRPG
jgi:hypothetical protein